MHLSAIRVFVDDLATARHFYEKTLGLSMSWSDQAALGFDLGSELVIESVSADSEPEDRALVGRFTGCCIAVDDIKSVHATLTARGVAFTGPPQRQAWGGTLAHFSDPSGNVLTFVEA